MVGLGGLEPPTSRLSGVRSNHLSYRPNGYLSARTKMAFFANFSFRYYLNFDPSKLVSDAK
jgi:hypothetical protein